MKYFINLKNLARKTFPFKIFQGKHFLLRSCKKTIPLQDLVSSVFFARILQDPLQDMCLFSRGIKGTLMKPWLATNCFCSFPFTFINFSLDYFGKTLQNRTCCWFSSQEPCQDSPNARIHKIATSYLEIQEEIFTLGLNLIRFQYKISISN